METGVNYLGLALKHPFVAGASPATANLDSIRRLEDAGAAALVLPSLFEEQIAELNSGRIGEMDPADPQFSDVLLAYPEPREYPFTPDQYLEHVRKTKAAVSLPVIASLNGSSNGAWLRWGELLERAGADALEVNFYAVEAALDVPGIAFETHIRDGVIDLKRSLKIPVSVKLSPFFTAFGNVARRLDDARVDGIVMFNRFFQSDIDTERVAERLRVELSSSSELLVRLRWLAILHGQLRASLALSGGIHSADDGVKAILAGAHAVQTVSGVLRNGPVFFETLRNGLVDWMEQHHVDSVTAMRGRVGMRPSADPGGVERAAYLRSLYGARTTRNLQ